MKKQLKEFIFSVVILDINIYIVEAMFNKLLFHEKTLTIRLNKALSVAELLATDSGIGIGIGIGGSTQHPGSQPTSWQGFPRVSAHELCRLSTANICRPKPKS